MAHLTETLAKFSRREITMADLRQACLRIADGDGPRGAELRKELAAARDEGLLKPSEYEGLEFALAQSVLAQPARGAVAAGGDDDDGSEDVTVLRPGPPAAEDGGAEDEGAGDEGSDDVTVIRPRAAAPDPEGSEDETVIRPRPTDPDATVLGDDAEATVLGAPGHDDAEDPTVLRPAGDEGSEDETVLRPAAAGGAAHEDDSEDETVLRADIGAHTDADDEETVLRPRGGDPTVPPGLDEDDERTVVVGSAEGGDRTLVVGSSDDEDRTVVAGSPEAEDRTMVVGGDADDATVVAGSRPADDDDATTLNPGAEDRTRVLSEGDGYDIFNGALDEPPETDTTGDPNTWDPTTASPKARPKVDRVFTKGSVLKDRFRLTDALGEGGMGTVWRAVDILKLEAEDRNPYVAIKLLQGDFKEHPEAFIALQRESSKQQRLAHPNIATVFDFDREAESGTVFMTMEVMKGSDLADFVKTIPEGGLDYEEAMPLVEQLGSGLSYAHQAGLVHSDLKPGNCFLTDERVVKLLDFGIARASATREESEGEKTKFDPGQLGALTPSYATIEMFQGLEPDPRDDIYAMAIIAYQLFTGKHPFNRRSAPKAMKEGMTVTPVDKLTKRQNRALARGLAFERDDRTPSVEEFLEELRPRKHNLALTVGMPVALAAALVLGLWTPVTEYIAESEREEILNGLVPGDTASIERVIDAAAALDNAEQTALVQSDPRLVENLVKLIAEQGEQGIIAGRDLATRLPDVARAAVMDDPRAVSAVVDFYQARIDGRFSPADGRHDYNGARDELAALQAYYPNRAEAFAARDALEERRTEAARVEAQRLSTLLSDGALLPVEGEDDVGDVLAVASRMRGDWPSEALDALLGDPAISETYAQAARAAIEAQDYTTAENVLEVGLRYAPADESLALLSRDVLAELRRLRDAERARVLEAELADGWRALPDTAAFAGLREQVLELAQVAPGSPLLGEIRARHAELFEAEFAALANADAQAARTLLLEASPLLVIEDVAAAAGRLPAAAGVPAETLDERVAGVETVLASPDHSAAWDTSLASAFKALVALAPADESRLAALRERIAGRYGDHATTLAARDDYAGAFTAMGAGLAFHPAWSAHATRMETLRTQEAEYLARKAEEERLARLETLKSTVMERAQSDEPQAAEEALAELREGLPGDDPFLVEQAPTAIAQAYWRLAAANASRDDFETAVALTDRGLELAPSMSELSSSRTEYLARLEERAVAARVSAPRALPSTPVRIGDGLSLAGAGTMPAMAGTEGAGSSTARVAIGPARASGDSVPTVALAGEAAAPGPSLPALGQPPALGDGMDEQVAARLLESLSLAPGRIADLTGPIESFGLLYPDAAAGFQSALADRSTESLVKVVEDGTGDTDALAAPLESFRAVFPDRADALETLLADRAGGAIVAGVREQRLTPGDAAARLQSLGRLFPGSSDAVTESVLANYRQAAVTRVREGAGSADGVAPLLEGLRASFGTAVDAIDGAVAVELVQALVADARKDPGNLADIAPRVRDFRRIVPGQEALLAERLLPTLVDGIAARSGGDAQALAGLGAPIAELTALFPDAGDVVTRRLLPVAVDAVVRTAREQSLDATLRLAEQVNAVLPGAADALPARLTPVIADGLAQLAREGAMAPVVDGVRGYLRLFPGAESAIEQRVAPAAVDALVARASRDGAGPEDLRADVELLTRDLPSTRARLDDKLAPVLADGLSRTVRASAPEFGGVESSLRAFESLFPERAAPVRGRLADTAAEVLAGVTRSSPLADVERALGAALAVFADAAGPMAERIGPLLGDRLVALAREGDVAALEQPLTSFGRLLPDARQTIEARVMPSAVDAIAASAGAPDADIVALRGPVETTRRLFPASGPELERKVAPLLVAALSRQAATSGAEVQALAEPVRAYRGLFPDTAPEMERRVAETLVESLSSVAAADPGAISTLATPLREFRALLPGEAERIDEPLAVVIANGLRARVSGEAEALAGLAEPVGEFRVLLPGRVDVLDRIVGNAAVEAVERDTRNDRGNLERAVARVEALGTVFPSRLDAVRDRVAPLVGEAVLAGARDLGNDIQAADALVGQYAAAFPASAAAVRADVAQVLWRGIETEVEKQPGQLAPVAELLRAYQQVFPDDYGALSGALASRTARSIQRNARDTNVSLVDVASQLEQFKNLFPTQHQEVAADVGGALADRLAGADVSTAARVTALAPALDEIRDLFPDRFATLQKRLGDKSASQVNATVATDPFKAYELQQAARKVFPQNQALAAIRIELPLPEVKQGMDLVNQGMLIRARRLLDAALAKNASHSTIPAFRSALESREKKGLEAYANYRRITRTSRRTSDHTRALAAARTLWRDNPDFKDIRPPAPNACIGNKAGLGGRIPCYDKVGKRRSSIGPVMVVVPAGGGVDQPYAISKFEVSVTDWNRYCSTSKECSRSKLKRTLPMHSVSAADIDKYLAWLSKITGATYRLPTDAEWVHASTAGGKQPKKDFNCTVVVGNQQLKGLSLSSFKSGVENGWGMVNYVGNVRELVRDGGGFAVRGGSYKDRLQKCDISLKESHGGQAEPITGFRVVRSISE